MSEPVRVIVTQRLHDFHACIESEHGVWGCGRTEYEAVGLLISVHSERFWIAIRWSDGNMTANHPDRSGAVGRRTEVQP